MTVPGPARDPGVRHPSREPLIDWPTVDVATMVAISRARQLQPPTTPGTAAFTLYFADHLKDTPAYQQAVGTIARASTPASPDDVRVRLSTGEPT